MNTSHDFFTNAPSKYVNWCCEIHNTEGEGWHCPLCAIDEAFFRGILNEPIVKLVFGDGWVMINEHR